jgi:hypothetical protein
MAAGKKTGGRTKGTPNKRRGEMESAQRDSGLSPLDYMLQLMRDETADPRRRDYAASQAAPYCHPKLANVELGNLGGSPFVVKLSKDDSGLI